MRRRIAQVELCRTHGMASIPIPNTLLSTQSMTPGSSSAKISSKLFLQAQPGRQAVRRNVLISVRNPYIAEDRRPQLLGDIGRNPPAADPVLCTQNLLTVSSGEESVRLSQSWDG